MQTKAPQFVCKPEHKPEHKTHFKNFCEKRSQRSCFFVITDNTMVQPPIYMFLVNKKNQQLIENIKSMHLLQIRDTTVLNG